MSHYKPYPIYKDSGVKWLGRVPEHWYVVRMRYAATLNPPVRRDLLDDPDQEVSFLPMEAIGEDGSLNLEQNRPVADVRSGYSYFGDGDVAFAKVTPCFENGKGALMRGLQCAAGFGTTELTVLRPNPAVADARYINYIVQGSSFRAFGAGAMTGAGGLKRVPDEFTRNFPVSLPELGEQRVIASNLDRETARIDSLIEKKTRFIELLREKRQALITHAVTKGLDPNVKMKNSGVEWLGEVPEHWAVCKLSFRYSVELGKMLDEKRITSTSLMPYLRNQDVQWDAVNAEDLPEMDIHPDELSRYTVRAGDLLVCEGGDVGRAAIWRGENEVIGYQKALHRLRPRDATADTAEFFFFALMAAKTRGVFEESDSKATIAHLPAEKFRQYRFAFPPVNEQREIAGHIRTLAQRLDQVQLKTERSIELLKERRSALITAAVTGQIDLREAV
ncbi:restriction endonuclease subunit S [Pseudomonas monteilii]|uniref:restriction endonuclease subunit S n=1 Tax=Pseudomonas monteilii TaxID=76759 RepID=UPI001E5C9371|nr:restriction endonuclease subunit S [Pseudomonas monteilii]MCE0980884.1 restriction endonuclease subunit S [Pseudomonas monteilii]MCE1015258.1 restriction endonuclease subunit S [Pseudomonas monteilii]WJO33597.1 restriction endonuclease subunit S [Pseudomonas monteilii]